MVLSCKGETRNFGEQGIDWSTTSGGRKAAAMPTVNQQNTQEAERIKEKVLLVLKRIAPEADLDFLDSRRRYREQFEFDSIDFLNFAVGIQDEFRIVIPEMDFPRLATLDGCLDYLKAKTNPNSPDLLPPSETHPSGAG
jgi:acyl carrier protein